MSQSIVIALFMLLVMISAPGYKSHAPGTDNNNTVANRPFITYPAYYRVETHAANGAHFIFETGHVEFTAAKMREDLDDANYQSFDTQAVSKKMIKPTWLHETPEKESVKQLKITDPPAPKKPIKCRQGICLFMSNCPHKLDQLKEERSAW